MLDTRPVAPPPSTDNRWPKHVSSIDAFRALTMLMMIFVNDLWTLKGVPKWLEHAGAEEDFLGVADVVFPCFLGIVGMSIPFAIRQRLSKGATTAQILSHIALRSVALLVMGVFTVNVPDLNESATGLSSAWFQMLMVVGFFLIWNRYPTGGGRSQVVYRSLQLAGVALLIGLAVTFRSGDPQTGSPLRGMVPQWWGILGLIGWTYFACASLYLLTHRRPVLLMITGGFFPLLCIATHAGWPGMLWPTGPDSWLIGNGAFHSFTFAGILAIELLIRHTRQNRSQTLPLLYVGIGAALVGFGVFLHIFSIISKIQATPPWVFICSGIAFLLYAGIQYVVDQRGKVAWFNPIKAAGTSTLTCYLLPYVYYSVADLLDVTLPTWLITGFVGLLKSLAFAWLIIGITALLGRINIKLKL